MSTTVEVTRSVPAQSWGRFACIAALIAAAGLAAWELACRSRGYAPGLDDTSDLWADARESVHSDSTVIVGSSRGLFDLDQQVLAEGLGAPPVQLCLVGSNPAPVLEHLAADPVFRGTVILDLVPGLLITPREAPPYQNAVKAVQRHDRRTLAERASHRLSLPLEWAFAFLQQDDLTLSALLARIPVPNRVGTQLPPALPPYFCTIDEVRQARMIPAVVENEALRERIRRGWLPLFTPPPKPQWIPDAAFGPAIGRMVEDRIGEVVRAIRTIRDRGGSVVLLRLPSTGELRPLEERITPRAVVWERILADSGAPGIWFEDHPELTAFDCPEWSHLTPADATAFTCRLIQPLRAALAH